MPQRLPLWLPLQTLLLLAIMAVLPCRAAIALPEAGDEGRLRTLLRSEALSYENGEGVERDPVRAAKVYCEAARLGEGARIAGGRWNLPGESAVYVSSSLALAAIECFVHLGEDGLHIRFVYFEVAIPDTVMIRRCLRPPRGWRAEPPGDESMRYGSAWLRSRRGAVLEVPP